MYIKNLVFTETCLYKNIFRFLIILPIYKYHRLPLNYLIEDNTQNSRNIYTINKINEELI